jgi:hypothetical protein
MRRALVFLFLCACPSEKKSDAPRDAAIARPVVDAASPPTRACRAIAADGATMDAGAEVPDKSWIDLAKGGALTTKEPRTGREVAFAGPARVMPCRENDEAWVLRGTVTASPGSGEAPGQEEWVVTPLGVVRYASAAGTIGFDEKLHVSLASGPAFVWAAEGTSKASDGPVRDADGWTRVEAGGGLVVTAAKKADARVAARRCSAAAQAAEDVARAISAPDANVGELGAKHVLARREARAACAVAALRVATLTDDDEQKALSALVAAAEERWRGRQLGEAKAR